MMLLTFLCLSLFRLALSLATYTACQVQKSGEPALTGCPNGTLYVSKTDPAAGFTSVQDAINSVPPKSKVTILIGKGDYQESINVTNSGHLTLLGQLNSSTDASGTASNTVLIRNQSNAKNGVSDQQTATLTVASPHGQSGKINFRAYNVNFSNLAANYSISPALASSVMHANASFYGCSFTSYQDTWYTGHGGNTYAKDCDIYGSVDYIFGHGKCWFQSVNLYNRENGGRSITAWRGTPGTTNGVYIADSRITRSPDANSTTVTPGQCSLGRPWNEFAIAVFLRTYMDDSILSAGFTPWNSLNGTIPNTTYYAEFDSYGPGGNTSARVLQDHILNSMQAANFTPERIFGGNTSWIDMDY